MLEIRKYIIDLAYKFLFISKIWYSFTMFVTKKKYKVKKYQDVKDIPPAFDFGKKYRYDMLFGRNSDHLTHPSLLQWRIDNNVEFGDCDDHAIYWCTALTKSKLAQKVWFAHYTMIKYDKEDSKKYELTGHAVCIYLGLDEKMYWCDYRNPKEIKNIRDFMYESSKMYSAEPIIGAIWEISYLKDDDTPKFGKITRIMP